MEGLGSFNSSWENVEEALETTPNDQNLEFTNSSGEHETHRNRASSNSRRVHYNRHTPQQIQELENYFKTNPHPNEMQRSEIGRKLNIEMKRVKFWFQNRRTQLKTRKGLHENAILKKENERLRLENLALQEAVKKTLCIKCGGDARLPDTSIEEHKLLIKNAQLKEELNRMTRLVNQLLARSSLQFNTLLNQTTTTSGDKALEELEGGSNNDGSMSPINTQSQTGIHVPAQRNVYLELATRAMEELLKLGMANAPLWYNNKKNGGEVLDIEEYVRAFPPCLGPKPVGFVSDATRASGVVSMSSSAIIEALLDANQWREMFMSMIGSCSVVEMIANGVEGSRNGVLQLMKTEIQLISSLVPVRVTKFIRFVKQQEEGVWAVVDLSIDAGTDEHLTRRSPSGCILHDMPNGFSKVTWIEHVEYNDQLVPNQYCRLISFGVGFGAQRWISALLRHCEGLRVNTLLSHQLYLHTRKSLKALAQRMRSLFCAGVCLTGGQRWSSVVDPPEGPRIMARKCTSGLGQPSGIIVTATNSVWISAKHRDLFDLLLRKDLRSLWDVMCHELSVGTTIHFPQAEDETSPNCISILNSDTPVDEDSLMLLQETCSDMTGSLIVYATVDRPTVSAVMNGYDTSDVALLPIGLCIVPGYGEGGGSGGECGSMVTVGFHMLLPDLASNLTMEIVSTMNKLVSRTVSGIKEIVRSDEQGGYTSGGSSSSNGVRVKNEQ